MEIPSLQRFSLMQRPSSGRRLLALHIIDPRPYRNNRGIHCDGGLDRFARFVIAPGEVHTHFVCETANNHCKQQETTLLLPSTICCSASTSCQTSRVRPHST